MTAREYFQLYSPALAAMVLYFAMVGVSLTLA